MDAIPILFTAISILALAVSSFAQTALIRRLEQRLKALETLTEADSRFVAEKLVELEKAQTDPVSSEAMAKVITDEIAAAIARANRHRF